LRSSTPFFKEGGKHSNIFPAEPTVLFALGIVRIPNWNRGNMLMVELSILEDGIIYREMMAHPVLFTHPHPQTIAVIGDETTGILQEALKHPNITDIWQVMDHKTKQKNNDQRVHFFNGNMSEWLSKANNDSFDIIIVTLPDTVPSHFKKLFKLLKTDGMLIQQSDSPFHLHKLKTLQETILTNGFSDIHFLSFSQPRFPSGWRTAVIAKKQGNFCRIREKDIFNKLFSTRYYNFDIHKASLVLPEFMREELESLTE
jgi:spermidine synthase